MYTYQQNWQDKVKTVACLEDLKSIVDHISSDLMDRIRLTKEAEHAAAVEVERLSKAKAEHDAIAKAEAERKYMHDLAQELKQALPKFSYMAERFEGDVRNAQNAYLNGHGILDADSIWDMTPEEYWQQLVDKFATRGEDIREACRIVFVHKTPSGHGLRFVYKCNEEKNLQQNMLEMYDKLEIEPHLRDTSVYNPDRVSYGVPESYWLYMSDDLFTYVNKNYQKRYSLPLQKDNEPSAALAAIKTAEALRKVSGKSLSVTYNEQGKPMLGAIPYEEFVREYEKRVFRGKLPASGERNTSTYEMAKRFGCICDYDEELLRQVIPCYNGLPEEEHRMAIHNAVSRRTQMSPIMSEVVSAVKNRHIDEEDIVEMLNQLEEQTQPDKMGLLYLSPAMKASMDGLAQGMTMAAIGLSSSIIGFLCTRVRLYIHCVPSHLNLINFIVGESGSNKGQMDPLEKIWLEEEYTKDKMYRQLEASWEEEKRNKINKTEQPKELHLKRRIFSLRSSIAKILQRMQEIAGQHGWSFTSEADQLAQNIKSAFADLTVIIRNAFDNSSFSQDYKSLASTNVFIEEVMWNFVACCTSDVLIRIFFNVTNGSSQRAGVFTTPDNTYDPLQVCPPRSEQSEAIIRRTAHLLPLMQGDVRLDKLEERCQAWLERVRIEAAKNGDKVKARLRMRVPVIAMRITCALMLTDLADWLYQSIDATEPDKREAWTDGAHTAEEYLSTHPDAAPQLLPRFETEDYMQTFDTLSDYLMETQLQFFGQRIKKAYESPGYITIDRKHDGKNDSIYDHLPKHFTKEDLIAACANHREGEELTTNALKQMVKNWKKAGLVNKEGENLWCKLVG